MPPKHDLPQVVIRQDASTIIDPKLRITTILGNGETVAEGRKRLFGGKANEGAEEYAKHWGVSLEEANEEIAVEKASVEDIVKAVRDADRTILDAGVQRVFDAVRRKIGLDMGVSERVITDADVRAELRHLWNHYHPIGMCA